MKRLIVSSRTERVVFVAALLAALGLVAWNVAHIGNFIEDDTLISLRYSQRGRVKWCGIEHQAARRIFGAFTTNFPFS